MVSEETAERIIDAYTISFFIGLSPLTSKKYVFKDYAKCNLFVFLFIFLLLLLLLLLL